MCSKLRGVMPTPKFLEVRISAESWNVVLEGVQARQGIYETEDETEDETEMWMTIYEIIIGHKSILDTFLRDYNNGSYIQCPLHTIRFPSNLIHAVNKLLPK